MLNCRTFAPPSENGQTRGYEGGPMNPDDNIEITEEDVTTEELLVEEVSIDGLCGVY
jgi:mycofactocin precursor